MHKCAEVTEAVMNILPIEKSKKDKEIFSARVNRDHEDFQIIQSWFKNRNPFTSGEQLIALDSGIVDSENHATCDQAGKIGTSIQKNFGCKTSSNRRFQRKHQISSLNISRCVVRAFWRPVYWFEQ